MTKKQLKQLAKKLADLEYIIQTNPDKNAVDRAKDEMIKMQESADVELDELVVLDGMVLKYLENKNI